MQPDQGIFIEKHKELIGSIHPIPEAQTKTEIFVQMGLYECSYVFLSLNEMRPPLKKPYSGTQQLIRRIENRKFIILINSKEATIS